MLRSSVLSTSLLSILLTFPAAADRGARNPDAPPETEQFAFLIGEWACEIRSMQPDGSLQASRATWTARYILDGWAIQDHWVGHKPDGTTSEGTNIRSFNPQTKVWDNRWLSTGALQWKYFSAVQDGETMVMTGGEGSSPRGDFVDRNTFYDIGPDGFQWRKDRSFDGGKSWFEGVVHISATRSK